MDPSRALKTDDPALMKRNARKLLEATNKLSINVMNEPRQGKKLLVLDLDYTILVCRFLQAPWAAKLKDLPFSGQYA